MAMVSEIPSLDIVKLLLASQANYQVRDKHNQDNILHLAARYQNKVDILEYLVKSIDHDLLFERNMQGDTPLSISEERHNQPAIDCLVKL